eukprot:CAMPEP_0198323450 /NCGR_PEP_ID=MMETSP1450-20131203/11684_1 /TAXON_ID=753684 ORGANISM="Madagascaria erythrocladiodes, Strain CCMP3234" /NCGR_SAMPLE_ID=MMETSP1450 /ASSEMBLY_ACC=CAM_ASM_001115 /LENGTH=485 /DNA_ID=CAMNT_0044027153 /DNA_START=450 /DNA_END=1907 /DNA_ORIENTATION=+
MALLAHRPGDLPFLSGAEVALLCSAGYDPHHPSLPSLLPRCSSETFHAPTTRPLPPAQQPLAVLGIGRVGFVVGALATGDRNKVVAVKVVRKAARTGAQRELVDGEVEMLKKVAALGHGHVVGLEEVLWQPLVDGGTLFIVTEYLAGGTVAQWLKKGAMAAGGSQARRHVRGDSTMSTASSSSAASLSSGLLSAAMIESEQILRIAKQMVWALAFLHGRRMIHRDVRLENLMFVSDPLEATSDETAALPEVKLIDFGCSIQMEPSSAHDERLSRQCGQPACVSPEIAAGRSYDPQKSEVWACGVALYRMVTGRYPFEDKNGRCATDFGQAVRLISASPGDSAIFDSPAWANHPANLQGLVRKMLKKNETDRPSLNVVLGTLDCLLSDVAATLAGSSSSLLLPKKRGRSSFKEVLRRGYSLSERPFSNPATGKEDNPDGSKAKGASNGCRLPRKNVQKIGTAGSTQPKPLRFGEKLRVFRSPKVAV